MNWNSGEGLYKIMLVISDFAKTLPCVVKHDLMAYGNTYA